MYLHQQLGEKMERLSVHEIVANNEQKLG